MTAQMQVKRQVSKSRLMEPSETGVYLYWLPLGAGGSYVKLNGRIFEFLQAQLERRLPLDLYHTALKVRVPEALFVIENSWPIPDSDGPSRGVVVEGPVFSRRFRRFSPLRYEVRLWRDGVIADVADAVASPQWVSRDPDQARRLLDLASSVPPQVWGRDEEATGDMWNSNSVISYLLARSGVPTDGIQPPAGGRAPGWHAGLELARRAGHHLEGAHASVRPYSSSMGTAGGTSPPRSQRLTHCSGRCLRTPA